MLKNYPEFAEVFLCVSTLIGENLKIPKIESIDLKYGDNEKVLLSLISKLEAVEEEALHYLAFRSLTPEQTWDYYDLIGANNKDLRTLVGLSKSFRQKVKSQKIKPEFKEPCKNGRSKKHHSTFYQSTYEEERRNIKKSLKYLLNRSSENTV